MSEAASDKPKFVYVTYIRTTAEKLWRALTEPEFTRQFWVGTVQECEWKQGAPWRMMIWNGGSRPMRSTRPVSKSSGSVSISFK